MRQVIIHIALWVIIMSVSGFKISEWQYWVMTVAMIGLCANWVFD